MRITKIVKPFALSNTNALGSGGGIIDSSGGDGQFPGSGQVPVATGSNGWAWGSNVQRIFSNTSNALLGPFVNFQSGSGIALSASSNTVTITSSGGGGSGDMTKAVYDTDNDGLVDLAEALRTSEIDVYSAGDDKCLNVRARDTNAYTRILVQPHGNPSGGDTAIHLYYDRTGEGGTYERFLGLGATHGGGYYSIASGDAGGAGQYLPILFYMENGATVLEVMRLNADRSVEFWKHQLLREISAPSTPASGAAALYVKSDGKIYLKNDAGTEYDLTAGVDDHGGLTGLLDDDHTQYVLRSILTTTGDMFVRDTSGIIKRFAVGSNGKSVIADSNDPLGVRWSTAAPSGELLISDTPAGSPLIFGDLVQNEAQDDLLYGDL